MTKLNDWLKLTLFLLALYLVFAGYYALIHTQLLIPRFENQNQIQTEIHTLLINIEKSEPIASKKILDGFKNAHIRYDSVDLKLSISPKPMWKESFKYSKYFNNQQAAREVKLIPISASFELKNGSWLNLKSRYQGKHNNIISATFIVASILILMLVFYLWLAGTFYMSIKQIDAMASGLQSNLRTKLNSRLGVSIVNKTLISIQNLQRYMVSLINQRSYIIGAISHDLRKPLAVLEIMLDEVESEELKAKMSAKISDMKEMIVPLLNYSQEDVYREKKVLIELVSLLWGISDDFVDQGCALNDEIGPDTIQIVGASHGLKRCFENVLSNAFKYGSEATLKVLIEKGEAVIYVTDNGPGVDKDYLN